LAHNGGDQASASEDETHDNGGLGTTLPGVEATTFSVPLRELVETLKVVEVSTQGEIQAGVESLTIESLSNDSRDIGKNCVFFCIKGTARNGHDYAAQAVENGAIAVVASEPAVAAEISTVPVLVVEDTQTSLSRAARSFYGDPSTKLSTVAVTGTNGKTTTSWLVRGIFEEAGYVTGMIGTVEYALAEHRLDSAGQIWEASEEDPSLSMQHTLPAHIVPYAGKYEVENTTPDALSIQKIMASMVSQGGEAVVMEASSHALELRRCEDVDFNVGIFTNLTRDHMDFHSDMESYTSAKLKLFELLSTNGAGVVNLDDPSSDLFVEVAGRRGLKLLTFSSKPESAAADITCRNVCLSLFETQMQVSLPQNREIEITSSLLGNANVSNILAAVSAGVALGFPDDVIANGIKATEFVPGRYELINEGQDFAVLVDYAHTPDALSNVLDDVRSMGANRVISVFGCGGCRDVGKRSLMGRIAHEKSDIVFVTSDNPRTENPDVVIDDIVSGFSADLYEQFQVDKELGLHWLQDIHNLDPVYIPDSTTRRWEKFKYTGNRTRSQYLQNSVRRYVVQERYYAIRLAIGMAEKGDAVVIAGKGHEDYQILANHDYEPEKSWFDDRVESYAALQEMAKIQAAGWDTSGLPWVWGKPKVQELNPDDILEEEEMEEEEEFA
jgi:UDP-N-acetylmuramyl tripeptide synthase